MFNGDCPLDGLIRIYICRTLVGMFVLPLSDLSFYCMVHTTAMLTCVNEFVYVVWE